MTPDAARIRWRCRRGMKELDILLERFIDERFDSASLEEQEVFQQLLEVQDPLIYAYCFGKQAPPSHFAALIERITSNSSLEP